jgi:hypothetical protein
MRRRTRIKISWLGVLTLLAALVVSSMPATAQQTQQQTQKPNILFIMGDDIGWMQPSIYITAA